MKHDGLVISPKTFEWSGALPKGTQMVHIQVLDDDDIWKPKLNVSIPRPRAEAMELLEKTVRKGPCTKRLYRVFPVIRKSASITLEHQEDSEMSKKKAMKKSGTPKKDGVLIGGRFREGSDLAKMHTLLEDGKARTIDEIQTVVKASVKANIGLGKYASLSTWGKESGRYQMEKSDGKIRMILKGGALKKEGKPTGDTKKAATSKTKNIKKEASDRAKKKTSSKPSTETKESDSEIQL